MAKLALHVATIGAAGAGGALDAGNNYFFMTTDGGYTEIAESVGIAKATEAQQDAPAYLISELQKKGILMRIAVTTGGGTLRPKTYYVLVARDKLLTALEGLNGKTYKGGTITSARIARKAIFS